ncbi:MAG: hypothetical protein ACOCYC_01250 [bacterium]
MPDMLFSGGPIVTVDPDRPRAEALLVRSNRIAAVGSLDESGEPTGIVEEPTNYKPIRRARLRRELGQILSPRAKRDHLRAARKLLAEVGITSVQDNTWFPWTMWAIRGAAPAG